jgi:hypothetical protein
MNKYIRFTAHFLGTLASTFLIMKIVHSAPVGFYRFEGHPAVFYQYSDQNYCHVQNEVQMAAFGGFNQVRVVNRNTLSGTQTGACGWPNGLYRGSQFREVYLLYGNSWIPNLGDKYCHVANENDLSQIEQTTGFRTTVINLQPSEYFDLKAGRSGTGTCKTQVPWSVPTPPY